MSIIDDVTDCVIAHYSARFHRNDILSDTDIKTRFHFNSNAWAAEAEALSELTCISKLNVRIAQSSMNANTTPESLARLVDGLVKKAKAGAPAAGMVRARKKAKVAKKKAAAKKKVSKKKVSKKNIAKKKKKKTNR